MSKSMTSQAGFRFWVLVCVIYGIPNLITFLYTLESGIVQNGSRYFQLSLDHSSLFICIILILLSLGLVIGCANYGVRFFQGGQSRTIPAPLGVVVFVVQLLGILALFWFDFGRVGGARTSSSIIAITASYLHPDQMFLIYYGHCRSKRIPYWNLLLYIVSSTLRGWSGLWIILFFVEFYYWAQHLPLQKLLVRVLFCVAVGLAAFPVIYSVRESIRGSTVVERDAFSDSMTTLFQRLEHVSAVGLIAEEAPSIKRDIDSGYIIPFYLDNQIGEKIRRFFNLDGVVALARYLTLKYFVNIYDFPFNFYEQDLGWSIHTGIAGWLFILNWGIIPVYLFFVCMLVVVPYWIAGRFIGERSILPVLHTVAVMYVFHGWFGAQVDMCSTMALYVVLYFMTSRLAIALRSDKRISI